MDHVSFCVHLRKIYSVLILIFFFSKRSSKHNCQVILVLSSDCEYVFTNFYSWFVYIVQFKIFLHVDSFLNLLSEAQRSINIKNLKKSTLDSYLSTKGCIKSNTRNSPESFQEFLLAAIQRMDSSSLSLSKFKTRRFYTRGYMAERILQSRNDNFNLLTPFFQMKALIWKKGIKN